MMFSPFFSLFLAAILGLIELDKPLWGFFLLEGGLSVLVSNNRNEILSSLKFNIFFSEKSAKSAAADQPTSKSASKVGVNLLRYVQRSCCAVAGGDQSDRISQAPVGQPCPTS
jgi:hypothetical protein